MVSIINLPSQEYIMLSSGHSSPACRALMPKSDYFGEVPHKALQGKVVASTILHRASGQLEYTSLFRNYLCLCLFRLRVYVLFSRLWFCCVSRSKSERRALARSVSTSKNERDVALATNDCTNTEREPFMSKWFSRLLEPFTNLFLVTTNKMLMVCFNG